IDELKEKVKNFETKQDVVKKMEEFTALTQEVSTANRERVQIEQELNILSDKLIVEEEVCDTIGNSVALTEENSRALEEEIAESIGRINSEGRELQKEREKLIKGADSAVFVVYERLLSNKRDRVVVPIENRVCMGCHIQLTAQHENLVRKGERLIFCEHCSRIVFWQPPEAALEEGGEGTVRRRRRRVVMS
ncbi:hypothetical protein JYU14_04970, partial [Simkania negevensis]|nr:hypothetical protein [Simkania negevensis]